MFLHTFITLWRFLLLEECLLVGLEWLVSTKNVQFYLVLKKKNKNYNFPGHIVICHHPSLPFVDFVKGLPPAPPQNSGAFQQIITKNAYSRINKHIRA